MSRKQLSWQELYKRQQLRLLQKKAKKIGVDFNIYFDRGISPTKRKKLRREGVI